MSRSRSSSSLEQLESRIAPASVTLNAAAKMATWTDFDGDAVTMKWTSTVPPTFTSTDKGAGLVVDRIDLTAVDHTNAALTISVTHSANGDGLVDLGRLAAAGVALKSLTGPKASFAEIDCGDGQKSIGNLSIGSLGTIPGDRFTGSNADGVSLISGVFTSFKLAGDVGSGTLNVGKSDLPSGSIFIGGNVRGDSKATLSNNNGNVLFNGTQFTSFTLGGSIIGGDGNSDGAVNLNGNVGKVTIKGNILGGEDINAGSFFVNNVATLTIGGSVVGGSAQQTGYVTSGDITTLKIGGSIIGGSGISSGALSLDETGKTTILGSIVGGTSSFSGYFNATNSTAFTLNGALAGGTDHFSGCINFNVKTGTFLIKGGIFGNEHTAATTAGQTATVQIKDPTSVTILGGIHAGRTFTGTALSYNGALLIGGNAGTVTIKGGLTGNDEKNAYVLAGGTATPSGDYVAIGKLLIFGDVSYATIATGHTKDATTPIGDAENPDAGLGLLSITGNWLHSSLLVGVSDKGGVGANGADTHEAGDAARIARLGSVKITGKVLDDPSATGFSGFEAEKIGKLTVAGAQVFKTGDTARFLDFPAFVIVREI